jgi:hypothetical protein
MITKDHSELYQAKLNRAVRLCRAAIEKSQLEPLPPLPQIESPNRSTPEPERSHLRAAPTT